MNTVPALFTSERLPQTFLVELMLKSIHTTLSVGNDCERYRLKRDVEGT